MVAAIAKANVVSPSGNMTLGDRYPIVPTHAIVTKPAELADVPHRTAAPGSTSSLNTTRPGSRSAARSAVR